jgi:ABC-2 type transport system ATP-binding protein
LLCVTGLTKSYGEQAALQGVDLEVSPGEILAVLGPNGAGKTTLMSIIAGVCPADSGRVVIAQRNLTGERRAAQSVLGFAPQELGIYPVLTVGENLAFFGELQGLYGRLLRVRILETAQLLGIKDLLDRKSGTLSGGQQRRLHTGIAMLHRPALLLLDEPTVGADPAAREQLLGVVRGLAQEGSSVCYSTHYLPEVEALGARVAMLDSGKLVAEGSIEALIARYGRGSVTLEFHGPVPSVIGLEGATRRDGVIGLETQDPSQAVGEALVFLGEHAASLRRLDVRRASLETVYHELVRPQE